MYHWHLNRSFLSYQYCGMFIKQIDIKSKIKYRRLMYVHKVFSIIVIIFSFIYLLRKKCPYSELFWSSISRIWTEYSTQMLENADQNNSEYRHFLRSGFFVFTLKLQNLLIYLFQICNIYSRQYFEKCWH